MKPPVIQEESLKSSAILEARQPRARVLPQWAEFFFAATVAIALTATISHRAARAFGLQTGKPVYRRIGPTTGPQVFCAGSSLLQFGISWPTVSEGLKQGIECWAIGGSSPEVWEVPQRNATNSNVLIVGFSVYDLNENRLCDSRANVVPVVQTISDLWRLKPGLEAWKRVLSQYPLVWVRTLFPTAGKSDAVLVGLRRKLHEFLRSAPPAEEKANALVLPSQPTLDFGASTEKLSDWPADKALRRITLLRNEIHGIHRFDGLQQMALIRMLERAAKQGKIFVIVMPVAPRYAREFLQPEVIKRFEDALAEAQRYALQARFVRLDRLETLNSDALYSDFIHLNGAGREIATEAFLKELKEGSAK